MNGGDLIHWALLASRGYSTLHSGGVFMSTCCEMRIFARSFSVERVSYEELSHSQFQLHLRRTCTSVNVTVVLWRTNVQLFDRRRFVLHHDRGIGPESFSSGTKLRTVAAQLRGQGSTSLWTFRSTRLSTALVRRTGLPDGVMDWTTLLWLHDLLSVC